MWTSDLADLFLHIHFTLRITPMFLALDAREISASHIFKDTLSSWDSSCLLPCVKNSYLTVVEFQVICMHPLADLFYACFHMWHGRPNIVWVTGHIIVCRLHRDVWKFHVCKLFHKGFCAGLEPKWSSQWALWKSICNDDDSICCIVPFPDLGLQPFSSPSSDTKVIFQSIQKSSMMHSV